MTSIERITQAVYRAIEEVNHLLPADKQLEQALNTILFDSGGRLDSLELVNLIVAAEQNIEDEFGVPIALADERAMSQERSPFRTVATFVEYIFLLFEEHRAMPAPVTASLGIA